MEEGTPNEIFLYDKSIQQLQPLDDALEESFWSIPSITSTAITRYIGIEKLSKNLGPYHLDAIFRRYEADIKRKKTKIGYKEDPNLTEDSILFSGIISIINPTEDIPGREMMGRIWTATKNTPEMREYGSFEKMILGHDPDKYCQKVEAILNGYKRQGIEQRHETKRREDETYMKGRLSTKTVPLGTF